MTRGVEHVRFVVSGERPAKGRGAGSARMKHAVTHIHFVVSGRVPTTQPSGLEAGA
jgi:hypothetical protein